MIEIKRSKKSAGLFIILKKNRAKNRIPLNPEQGGADTSLFNGSHKTKKHFQLCRVWQFLSFQTLCISLIWFIYYTINGKLPQLLGLLLCFVTQMLLIHILE